MNIIRTIVTCIHSLDGPTNLIQEYNDIHPNDIKDLLITNLIRDLRDGSTYLFTRVFIH